MLQTLEWPAGNMCRTPEGWRLGGSQRPLAGVCDQGLGDSPRRHMQKEEKVDSKSRAKEEPEEGAVGRKRSEGRVETL